MEGEKLRKNRGGPGGDRYGNGMKDGDGQEGEWDYLRVGYFGREGRGKLVTLYHQFEDLSIDFLALFRLARINFGK